MNSRLKVLFIPFEGTHWAIARGVPYSAYLGLEEGFKASDAQCLTIPATWSSPAQSERTAWLNRAKEICAGKRFDQVWVEILHTHLDDDILDWIAGLAPVRVGLLLESLTYNDEELALTRDIHGRQERIEHRLKYITHLAAVDEKDVTEINARQLAHAMWSPAAVAGRFVNEGETGAPDNYATFIGNPYWQRGPWLEHSQLKGRLVHMVSSENKTRYPNLFDWLNRFGRRYSESPLPASPGRLLYVMCLRGIRRQCFRYYLESLQLGCAVVNLPHFVKTYSYRVVETMAAGRPAISWEIPDRPLNKALFEDGKEILLYKEDEPGQLAEHIERVIAEPALAKLIVENARRNLIRFHTVEKRVQQTLRWIGNGDAPSYV